MNTPERLAYLELTAAATLLADLGYPAAARVTRARATALKNGAGAAHGGSSISSPCTSAMQTKPDQERHRMFDTIQKGVAKYQGWSVAKQRACTQYLADSARPVPKIRSVGERPAPRERAENSKS